MARYDRKLHGVLPATSEMSCHDIAGVLGRSPRTIEYRVGRFNENGFAGLRNKDGRGRPHHLEKGGEAPFHQWIFYKINQIHEIGLPKIGYNIILLSWCVLILASVVGPSRTQVKARCISPGGGSFAPVSAGRAG